MKLKPAPFPFEVDIAFHSNSPVITVGNTFWIFPKQGQWGAQVTIDVKITNRMIYQEMGALAANTYYTKTLGTYSIDLYQWRSTSKDYVWVDSIAHNVPWWATSGPLAIHQVDSYNLAQQPAWRFKIKITLAWTGLFIWAAGDWRNVPLPWPLTMIWDPSEEFIITSRYDIGGDLYKPLPTPTLQPIADLKTNVKDTYACGQAFGSRPGYPNWNTAADVNNDFKVDVKDYYAISQNFGWVAPNPLGP
jgi:hypothetical protein